MITIAHLKKSFGKTIACDIEDFVINNGEILGLVGNNGAGKTTLFRLLLDLLKSDAGTITYTFPLQGEEQKETSINPVDSESWKRFVGAYIDEGFLIDFLTPEEYFAFLGKISGITQSEVDERLKMFEHFANGELFGQKKLIRNLSAGNKQKAGIISALFRHPQIVILDEPFNFLDPTSQSTLKHVLSEYNHQTGATIIISSHNLAHTIDVSSRIALLEHGRIISDMPNINGSAAQTLTDYFEARQL